MLAPPVSAEHEVDEDPDELRGEWNPALGYPDTRRVVRIWVDDDTRRLTKVRLSPRWRERLGTHRLEDAFAEAFLLANARLGEVPALTVPEPAEPEIDPALTWDDLPRIQEQVNALLEQAADLIRTPPEDIVWADFTGQQVSGTAARGNVTVILSLAGTTESVRFDRSWLAGARMNEVADAVLSAHGNAYARYVAPTFIPGDHELLADELAQARRALGSISSKEIL